MPTYEYLCDSCSYKFEKFQSMTDKPLRRCPKCGKGVRRLLGTGGGVLFKGSGFYQTDYRSKSYQEGTKKDSSKQEKKEGDAPAKPEAAPQKKSGNKKGDPS